MRVLLCNRSPIASAAVYMAVGKVDVRKVDIRLHVDIRKVDIRLHGRY